MASPTRSPAHFLMLDARAYGDRLTRFLDIKRRLDPQGLFQNDQARRLGLVPAR